MSLTDLTTTFIAGYKHHPDDAETHWLCNHPESLDLIFSKDKMTAFAFDDKPSALQAIEEILIAENHAWYTPMVENFHPKTPLLSVTDNATPLQQAELKINGFLNLFNERSNSGLKLFLTLNKKDNSIRGYGTGIKLGDAVINFVALLTVKGMQAKCLDQHTFIVKVD